MSSAPPDMKRVRRLLIVKLSSIGDVVHALPVSAALGEAFPWLGISWIVGPVAAPLLDGNPYLKDVIVLPRECRPGSRLVAPVRGYLRVARDLRRRRFDMVLDLQGLSKSALLAAATGARWRFGWDWLRELAPLVERRVPRRHESVHVVDQFLDVARFLGAPAREVRFPLAVPGAAMARAADLLVSAGVRQGSPFVVMNPSAGAGGHKGWGADRFAALANELGRDPAWPVVLVGAGGDIELSAAVARSTGRPVCDLTGQTSVGELSALLSMASLHVCGDTGSAHIAAALGTPVVSIFGRSDPARLAPYGQEQFALHHRECCTPRCREYHEAAPVNASQKCLQPPPACLAAVTVEETATMCRKAIAARPMRPLSVES